MKKNTKVETKQEVKDNGEKKFEISTKHVPLRIALFIISLCLGIGGIGFGIYSFLKPNDSNLGWNTYLLSDMQDATYPGYHENVVLNYYVSNQAQVSAIKTQFKNSATEIYQDIDWNSSHEYNNVRGIGYLNAHRGENVEISETLYNILVDAKEKTYEADSAYSMFSGLTYHYWSKLYASNNVLEQSKDPTNSVSLKNKLDDITAVNSNLSNFTLDLTKDGEHHYAKFSVSKAVEDLISDYDLDEDLNHFSILNLNTLFYSYYLDYIGDELIGKGFTGGYLTTFTGEMYYLSNGFDSTNDIVFYDCNTTTRNVITCGQVAISGKCVVSQIRSFGTMSTYESEYATCLIKDNNVKYYYRNMFYDYRTGYNTQNIMTSFLSDTRDSVSLPDVTFKNLKMYNGGSLSSYSITSDKEYAVVSLMSENSTVYLSEDDGRYVDYTYYDLDGKEQSVSFTRKSL